MWDRVPLEHPICGIYVGRRQKSNGNTEFVFEEGYNYTPVAFFEAWLVAYEDNRDILVVLPSDVKLEKKLE